MTGLRLGQHFIVCIVMDAYWIGYAMFDGSSWPFSDSGSMDKFSLKAIFYSKEDFISSIATNMFAKGMHSNAKGRERIYLSKYDGYVSPFSTRYASKEMQYLFSADYKFRTWRRLWIALAKAEKAEGLSITDEQIAELEAHAQDINYEVAEAREREVRHDVMSHVYAYGEQCPKAQRDHPSGSDFCYVGDNTDVVIMREALRLVRGKLIKVLQLLSDFALEYKDLPCLGYTHLQPAQLTTVGKRACLWLNEFVMDYGEIEHRLANLRLLGSKGTTGTQASFMELFEGDEAENRPGGGAHRPRYGLRRRCAGIGPDLFAQN